MEHDLSQVVRPSDYWSERSRIFQSKGSFDWFIRRHKANLVQRGAVLLLSGRWMVHRARCDAYLLECGAASARTHVS